MRLANLKLLFDLTIRLQIFVEAVKASEARQFDLIAADSFEEYKQLLYGVRYDTLDALSKSQLAVLIVKLRQSQARVYSFHSKRLLEQLELFAKTAHKVNSQVWAYGSQQIETDEDLELPSEQEAERTLKGGAFPFLFGFAFTTLWAAIRNAPMPANGALMQPMVNAWSGSAIVGLESQLRKGYANRITPKQSIAEVEKVLQRSRAQGVAVQVTAMQHIASMVSASIASGMFGFYEWVSVIDSSTTDICLHRNGKTWKYGEGPLPPAHVGCRSCIMPFRGNVIAPKETFYSFIKRQPLKIQQRALGNAVAEQLNAEKLKAKDVTKLTDPKPMSIKDFGDSARDIIS